MKKINDSTISFLKTHIDNLTDFLPLTEDSQFDLIHAVEDKFVIPLANALTENCAIDEELLKTAEIVIDDLNDDFDIDDFNERIKLVF
ncbi:MAG: hypothetical protein IKV43_02130 [Clostridia bacterium]|nr:hypothetical protein [Clostridia bacterium]